MATGEVGSRCISAVAESRHRTVPFVALPADGHGKIAKAYFWRSGSPPPQKHAGFVQFLRFLGQIRRSDQARIANLFTFKTYEGFQNWLRAVLPIAYDLERLAPALANDGPNSEYPWPHANPEFAPANHSFAVWMSLTSGQGRDLMRILRIAVTRFPEYADT